MAGKPLTNEAIALTEKKMDMTLDDIIKMSKKSTTKVKNQRASNKSQKFFNGGTAQGNASKVHRFMDSRSSVRQGVLAQRRSNFQGNQFPLATEVARKAAATPIRSRALSRNRGVPWSKPRVGAPPVQRRAVKGGFAGKPQQQQQQQPLQRQQQTAKVVPKQRPQTLDSLFANMKEQRMRVSSQQSNARRVGGAQQQQQQQQQRRGRGRFGNFAN